MIDKTQPPAATEVTAGGLSVSGEDRTPFELFIAGVQGWEADLRRLFSGKLKGSKPKPE